MTIFLIIQILVDIAFFGGLVWALVSDRKEKKQRISDFKDASDKISEMIEGDFKKEELRNMFEQGKAIPGIKEAVKLISDRVKDLENGLVPEYEQAKKATDAVNTMAQTINSIFSFDPMASKKEGED